MPIIQYIGRREEHWDSLYGTGHWLKNQPKDVPENTFGKMIKHPDVYVPYRDPVDAETEAVEVVEESTTDEEKGDDADQDARDAVNAMDSKDAVADYARTNFNQVIPKTLTLDNMKQRAITMIDQYGAQ